MGVINVLWTGGWDSTYRMVELSRMDAEVQPIYIKDHTRPSLEIEMETVDRLYKELKNDSRTKAIIHEVKYIEDYDIEDNEEIRFAYENIRKSVRIGSQYDYIARLALTYPGIEVGIEKPNGEFNGCSAAIEKYGELVQHNGVYVIDKTNSSSDCNTLFGNMAFPIINTTELEMVKNIQTWGYTELMKGIHFCYTPRNNQPCGICRPCQQKMECGMEMLLPKRAHIRYKVYTWRVRRGGIISRVIWRLTDILI